jgi:putative MFS transporter
MKVRIKDVLIPPVIVGALGYFVDIYDLLLFSIVRVPSLKSLGLEGKELLDMGVYVINMQMIGMLIGGIFWGILGDKKGRISVLFGSIFLYSIANLANAFVTDVETYGWLRFIAGIGLAGELGAAITLVSEVMPKEIRGYGTSVVAAVGLLGAVLAGIIGENFSWQTAYIIGGVLGLLLLFTRIRILESGIFSHVQKDTSVKKGDFLMLFSSRDRFFRYIQCILIGVPIWFVIGILVTFSPELSRALNVQGEVTGGYAILYTYVGLAVGDLLSGFLSQGFKSRKKIVGGFMLMTAVFMAIYLTSSGMSAGLFYGICVFLGVGTGYWALFVTIASEQFGTNIRATVTTTVPNFVRGSVVPVTLLFQYLSESMGLVQSAMWVGTLSLTIASIALWKMKETFGKDLNYLEEWL